MGLLRRIVQKFYRRIVRTSAHLPLCGYEPCNREPCLIDGFSNVELDELNRLLPWKCFTTDNSGRRFGNAAWGGKRTVPQAIPDPRIRLMHEYFELSDKRVLEVGCFEGVHTIGLCDFAKAVVAVDARVENVVKTTVRCAAYGCYPTISLCDIEKQPLDKRGLSADVMHHVGVLYHLKYPVEHLLSLGSYIRAGLMLDTHFCAPDSADSSYEHDGRHYQYRTYREFGSRDPFSGMYDHAKWLLLEDILELLRRSGFPHHRVVERREERNGPRVLLFASRDKGRL